MTKLAHPVAPEQVKKLREETIEKLKQRRHKVKNRKSGVPSGERLGTVIAIPSRTLPVWCCPIHGPCAIRIGERSINNGIFAGDRARGRWYVYPRGAPGESVRNPSSISWSEWVCPGGHVLRMHYDGWMRKATPGRESTYYHLTPDNIRLIPPKMLDVLRANTGELLTRLQALSRALEQMIIPSAPTGVAVEPTVARRKRKKVKQ
jgi:hypothetical protein